MDATMVLVGPILLLALLVLYVGVQEGRLRRKAGLGLSGEVLAADDSRLGSPTLRSQRLGLVGRPDHLVREGGRVIPVEHKPSARKVHHGHQLQLAALCALVEEAYGVRPPHGVLVISGGRSVEVRYTRELEREMLGVLSEMRRLLREGRAPGPRWDDRRCPPCGYRGICWR